MHAPAVFGSLILTKDIRNNYVKYKHLYKATIDTHIHGRLHIYQTVDSVTSLNSAS
jgi:hypothetical protein